ncbi:MAG: HD domain-containing protein [Aestuariivirgaceae bacterium]
MTPERWSLLMSALGLPGNEDTYASLTRAYAEPHRHYHNADHVAACLRQLDEVAAQAGKPHEIELALWFHDAVYDPFSSRNELDSADWAAQFMRGNDMLEEAISSVHRLIMVTQGHGQTSSRDEELMVDIDLSILGESPETYMRFEKAIRQEYSRVPFFLFRKKRKEILADFLQRDRLYNLEYFTNNFDAQARINLANAIAAL